MRKELHTLGPTGNSGPKCSTYYRDKWYAVPPYKNEGWKVLNESGELVATFEDKEDCIKAVELFNQQN